MTTKTLSLLALFPLVAALTGCSGGSAPAGGSSTPVTQTLGPLTTRIVGTAQSPVTSSAANGANVAAIAGALVDRLMLNVHTPLSLAETKIAFESARDGGNAEIYSMNGDGTNSVRLTNNTATESDPSWSPDFTKIVFSSNRDGNYEICPMNADGTNPSRLTFTTTSDNNPSWSPDGTKIVFTTDRDGFEEIYTMNVNGTGQTRLTKNAVFDVNPSWSPDGTKIVFRSSRDGNNEIYTMNANGSSPRRLTNNAAHDDAPSWSPDGKKIAFVSFRDGNEEIYTMNIDGSAQTRFTNATTAERAPVWAPDGSAIAFESELANFGGTQIVAMAIAGGAMTRISEVASDFAPSWSNFVPRTPKTFVGTGGALGTAAAGFFYGQKAGVPRSVVAFETSTVGSRAAARVASQSAPFNDQGADLIFSVTTSAGLASVNYVNLDELGNPGAAILPTISAGSTGAIVSFIASSGNVGAVIPYAANRSVSPVRSGNQATYSGNFTAVFDASGKNLAPSGAKSVTLDEKIGKLLSFK